MSNLEKYQSAMNKGDYTAALKILEAEKEMAKNLPDTVEARTGMPPKFKRKGRIVELGADGLWHPKNKLKK